MIPGTVVRCTDFEGNWQMLCGVKSDKNAKPAQVEVGVGAVLGNKRWSNIIYHYLKMTTNHFKITPTGVSMFF